VKLARRERDDATFHQDRLREAATKLAERVEAFKALEADRRCGQNMSMFQPSATGSPKKRRA
jgi:hypothetical protein